jgi:hypothetical protein
LFDVEGKTENAVKGIVEQCQDIYGYYFAINYSLLNIA